LTGKANTNQEVVVLGLFKRPKENFTGSATSVTGEQLRQVNNISVLDALKVFDPAVRIPDNSLFGSDPNRLPQITLRGTNNFPQQTSGNNIPSSGADFMANYATNPNQPLFILDGFEVSIQKIYDLDMNRIANFTILKDAAATSVYGSRAANGVIVVDTKQPDGGKLKLSYSGMLQITGPDLTVYDLTNAPDKLEVERLAGLYSTYAQGIRPDADAVLRETYAGRLAAVQKGINTYWLAKPVRTGYGQRHSVYLEGGDNIIRYGLDFGYNVVTGVMKNSDRRTYSGAMNFSYRNKGLLFKNVLTVTFNNAFNSNYGAFSDYVRQNPYWNPYDSNGNYVKVLESVKNPLNPTGVTNYYNPLYNTDLNVVSKSGYTTIINQTNIDWNIGKGLRVVGRIGITKQTDESDVFLPAQHTNFATVTDLTKRGSYTKGNSKFFSYDWNAQLEYSRRIGKHQVFNTTGVSASETKNDNMVVYVEGFPNQRLDEISFGNGYPPNSKPSGNAFISRRISGFSNFNYSYNNRYQADLSISADGSSQFGINNRFAPFWSLGTSWNIHKEKFIRHLPYISQARIRATIGTTGDSRFPPFMGITTYRYYTDQSVRGQVGAYLMGYGNPNLKWQQTLKRNIATDISFLSGRINVTVEFYKDNTKSLILDINTPPSVGVSSYRENVGELENTGYEFKVNAFLIRNMKKRVIWTVFVNGSHNRNYIKKISNALKKQNETNDKNDQTRPQFRFEEGQSVNAIWAVRSLGIDPSNGREVYLDRFGNMTYVWDPRDKVVVGDAVAKLRGNFGSSIALKGFTVSMFFSYEFGGQLYNQTLADRVEDANLAYNVDRRVLLGRWKAPGDETYFKGLVDENGRTVVTKTNATSRFVQKSNYVNAESITIGYLLPQKLNKYLGINNTRLSFTVNDIVRWSSIEIERGTEYPFARNFTINISTQF
ncbi:MAG TPA: SusC/RagA family TonB-linked outer membrane protein, partial [Chitinophagaceae bacterium]|nr:SusC/RagA family TonB-linked outer membrane protein [Chitinophagaceae bacterium]